MENTNWSVIRLANDYGAKPRRYFVLVQANEVTVMGMSGVKKKNREIMELNPELDHHMRPCRVLDILTYVQPGVVTTISMEEFEERRINPWRKFTYNYAPLPRDVDSAKLTDLMTKWKKKGLPINSPFTHVSQWDHSY